MIEFLSQFNPIVQALMATMFTWGVTALGAGIVLFTKQVNPKLMDVSLGFAGGVMVAASFWSLLAPSIAMAEEAGMIPWVPPAVGFMGGALFMRLVDTLLPHLHLRLPTSERGRGTENLMEAIDPFALCPGLCRRSHDFRRD